MAVQSRRLKGGARIRPSGPEGGPGRWVTVHHHHVFLEDAPRNYPTPNPDGGPVQKDRKVNRADVSVKSWDLTPAEKEREYWKTHKPVSAEQRASDTEIAKRNQDAADYQRNFHRAASEWYRDMKRDFEIAQNIITVLETAPKALAGAKKFLSSVGARRAAGGGGLTGEGLAAKRAADAAVARAEAAVDRAAKAAERYGASVAKDLKQEAANATKQAGAAVEKVQKYAKEEYAAEAVRRVSTVGPVTVREGASVEEQARAAGNAWASGIKAAIKKKTPITSGKTTLRGPGGTFLKRKKP